MTRQNNKRADRKIESNDSTKIPDSGQTSKSPVSLRAKRTQEFLLYRWKGRKVRNKTKEKKDSIEVASYDKPWRLRSHSLPEPQEAVSTYHRHYTIVCQRESVVVNNKNKIAKEGWIPSYHRSLGRLLFFKPIFRLTVKALRAFHFATVRQKIVQSIFRLIIYAFAVQQYSSTFHVLLNYCMSAWVCGFE